MSASLPGEGGALWLPDPTGRFDQRYWDGGAWTTAVMRGQDVLSDVEALPEGVPGSEITTPPTVPPVPPQVPGPSHVPQASASDRHTSLSPEETQRRLGQMVQMQGWDVTVSGPNQFDVVFTVPGKANTMIGVLLLLIWILPGVIYFIVKGRPTHVRASMIFIPADGGTRIALQGSPDALQRLGPIMVMLPW